MAMRTDVINGVPVLRVEGKIEHDFSREFIETVKELAKSDAEKLILDLHQVHFLDSASIGIICSLFIDRQAKGQQLEIITDASPTAFINHIFEITGLDKILTITKAV